MSGRSRRGAKANITGARPEPPAFIARMREQIVASEDAERRERSERRRQEGRRGAGTGGGGDDEEEDNPRVVKVERDDLSEEDYKRMKLELETQYKLDEADKSASKQRLQRVEELDIDAMIRGRRESRQEAASGSGNKWSSHRSDSNNEARKKQKSNNGDNDKKTEMRKKLSYGSSSDEDDDED